MNLANFRGAALNSKQKYSKIIWIMWSEKHAFLRSTYSPLEVIPKSAAILC